LKNNHQNSSELSECTHSNVKKEGGFLVCQDCGLIFEDHIDFDKNISTSERYKDSQMDYERSIKAGDSKAKQDPKVRQRYEKIQKLNLWFQNHQFQFTEQKKTIDLMKSYGINIDQVTLQAIKNRYLRYIRTHQKTYQNMVIIFLAIVWMEIKDMTNARIERFIDICNDLGHKINKKMINHATLKVKKTEKKWREKYKDTLEIEKEIKSKIKILFQKNLNDISYDKIKEFFSQESQYDKLKIEMLLLADKLLNKISYDQLANLNFKAFTAGLIYYIGQTLDNRKIFTQKVIETATKFSSTTIRKKFNVLKEILGDPYKPIH
jgi:hypothetical protein